MNQHKRYCDGAQQSDSSDESDHDNDGDDDDEENYVEVYEIVVTTKCMK